MTTINVADVDVKYRTVEVPDTCPMCGSRLASEGEQRRPAVRELNLASANFLGTFGRDDGDGFLVDTETGEEHPSDAVWIVFGYGCAHCGELLASGSIGVA
jgi:DNA-directed RNA polymerase subunit RPC12/RpoP